MLKGIKVVLFVFIIFISSCDSSYRIKILFLGNSITIHGPKEELGWNGHWGMANIADAIFSCIESNSIIE